MRLPTTYLIKAICISLLICVMKKHTGSVYVDKKVNEVDTNSIFHHLRFVRE